MWQLRPVFISSTFADMQAERDYLRTRVFPELEERLRGRRHSLEWVDLRVGVAMASERDEHVRELHVLKVCLDEVRRCRPFLIVLLGDRYGWVPPAERIQAAAEEAREGFAADVAGCSVTDLEIQFGVLSDPEQQPRSFFYFREPLPYADMPSQVAALYSEDFATDPAKADRKMRLAALKRRIAEQLPARVRRYSATWDDEHHRLAGLEDFGRMVLDDIWSELEAETKTSASAADVPWQQAQREALEDFVDDRARDFVGRQGLLDSLCGLATAAEDAGAIWGACVTGDPGSGKSALFGALYRRMHDSGVFLLAHAAGASVNAASVDSMLRRWIGELAAGLGTDPGLAENADPGTVDATFARLLGRMAQRRRVVVLVDALDQFENTTRGRYVTWLPRLWPANARFIATSVSGDAAGALAGRQGLEAVPLPPLDAVEARDIIAGICRRYHRTFEPEVVETLLAKRGPDGPAWGNPLWLVLAVEDLNLLDADDFARAHRDYVGTPAERLRALMLDTVAAFPPDIPSLYAYTFERAEDLFGASLTRGFLGLIAVSRAGWRETDFRILLPRASGENWDELKFAQLRRLFRGQLRQRGSLAQWDFSHAQMRAAVRAQLAAWGIAEQNLHTIVADRLLSCPPTDPLHVSETVVHLIAGEDWSRAAAYVTSPSLNQEERTGAARSLADFVLSADDETLAVEQVARLLNACESATATALLAHELLLGVCNLIANRATIRTQTALLEKINSALGRLGAAYPQAAALRWNLSSSHNSIGHTHMARGDLAAARASYLAALDIRTRLCFENPSDKDFQRELGASYVNIGDAHGAERAYVDAEQAYLQAFAIRKRLVEECPDEALLLHDFSECQLKLGDARMFRGDAAAAYDSYRAALAIAKRAATAAPKDLNRQRDVAIGLYKIGLVQAALRRDLEARDSYLESLGTSLDLRWRDPTNTKWERDVAVCYVKVGDMGRRLKDFAGAAGSYRASLEIAEGLVRRDPDNATWQRDLVTAKRKLAELPMESSSGRLRNGEHITLHDTARRGDLWVCRQLLAVSGADVNVRDQRGATALHWAAGRNQQDVARLLIGYGADVNAPDQEGMGPLQAAAESGHGGMTALLLDNGANADARGKLGMSALHLAVKGGHDAVARALIERGANVNVAAEGGYTPLHLAAALGRTTAVELLVARGANPQAIAEGELTPAHLAAQAGHTSLLPLLTQIGKAAPRKRSIWSKIFGR